MNRDPRDLRGRGIPLPDQETPFNHLAHRRSHLGQIKVLTYTSLSGLTTNAGSPIYPHVPVRLNVAGAPASTLTGDVLVDGASIYTVSSKPTIASGILYGDPAKPDVQLFTTTSKIQVQLTATGSATGPLVAQIKCFVRYDEEMFW